ncbi:MAG: murA [Oscillospiraceae bacterium]|nr:murA [Oscillospiraceae bacterium]
MSKLLVTGGEPLEGEVKIQGAKNSVLPILAATVLNPGVSVIQNCPRIRDVTASLEILRHLGCRAEQTGDTVTIDATQLVRHDVPDELMREMRSSVIFLGAILARLGEAVMCMPGGCELGPRPIDLHLASIRKMGGEIRETSEGLNCSAGAGLKGCELSLAIPSVGVTENIMLAACGAQGLTIITNAAREPEIVDLQRLLCSMGADVQGAGSSVITITGCRPLHDTTYRVMADRIVAATYLSAGAAAGGRVTVSGIDYRHLSTVTSVLSEAGCAVRSGNDFITLVREGPLRSVRPIRTAPYPGFPTDAQAPVMAALCVSQGATMFVENIFERRYGHVDELRRMGADISVEGRVALIYGIPKLHGAAVVSPDLRGGTALVVAALAAEGESTVTGLHHIDRGHQDIEGDLGALGGQIRRAE